MPTFKQFGGLQYSGTHNIVTTYNTHTTTHTVSESIGETNTRSLCKSHLDLSGNSLLRVDGIYFIDGTILRTAVGTTGTTTGSTTGTTTGSTTGTTTGTTTGITAGTTIGTTTASTTSSNDSHLSDKNHNTFTGTNALIVRDDDLAKYNCAYGEKTLMKNTKGYGNSGFGFESMVNNMTGSFNTAIGVQALAFNIAGTRNTAIGAAADVGEPGIHNCTMIGAGARAYASNVIQLGNSEIEQVITTGVITGKAKNFTIPHPLHILNKSHVLKHASVEAPRLDLIYRDTVQLANGEITIQLDKHFKMTEGTFNSLSRNPSVFVTNESDWDPIKGSVDMEHGVLSIKCKNNTSDAKVSFMVVVERKDEGIINSDMTDEEGHFIPEKISPQREKQI